MNINRKQLRRIEWLNAKVIKEQPLIVIDENGEEMIIFEDGSFPPNKLGGKGSGGGSIRYENYPK